MVGTEFESLPPVMTAVVDDVIPFFEQFDAGRYAVGLGGSVSKGLWDELSDIDFRVYHERPLPKPHPASDTWRDYFAIVDRWAERGVVLDSIWSRTIGEVDAKLDAWLRGEGTVDALVWTVWGYHILPDISRQLAIIDPYGIIAEWHRGLSTYPDALRDAILAKHLTSLRYWRSDYHYRHKVERGDVVFLAGISARLVHDIVQVLCAVNRVPFPGDGNNLRLVDEMHLRPERFRERVISALYPVDSETRFVEQYGTILALIDDTEAVVRNEGLCQG